MKKLEPKDWIAIVSLGVSLLGIFKSEVFTNVRAWWMAATAGELMFYFWGADFYLERRDRRLLRKIDEMHFQRKIDELNRRLQVEEQTRYATIEELRGHVYRLKDAEQQRGGLPPG